MELYVPIFNTYISFAVDLLNLKMLTVYPQRPLMCPRFFKNRMLRVLKDVFININNYLH